MKYIEDLQDGLERCIRDKDALLIGEDIGAPYGGAFKVTKDLSARYPDNFVMTPMSEQGFTGMGIGYAMQGGFAIVEVMFGDFITLCADQLVNHAAKLYDLYGNGLHFVLRTPSGGYRGYGATHSQSLERMFVGIPGLQVLAPSIFHSPGDMLYGALQSGMPTLFIENKLDYSRSLYQAEDGSFLRVQETGGIVSIEVDGEQPALTVITYGGMAPLVAELCEKLMLDEEIAVQALVISDLNTSTDALARQIKSERIVTVEEGWADGGIGAALLGRLGASGKTGCALGTRPHSIYSGRRLENEILPQESDVETAILDMVGR